jgi:hypothetical protein
MSKKPRDYKYENFGHEAGFDCQSYQKTSSVRGEAILATRTAIRHARTHSRAWIGYTMSAWRRIALEKLPKQRDLIAKSESVGMLWVDLWFVFVDAHSEPVDEATIQGVYEFAKWTCAESHDADMATSTCCHFYEHLPLEPKIRNSLPRFMSRQEVSGLSEIFKYHLREDEHRQFMQEFAGAHKILR